MLTFFSFFSFLSFVFPLSECDQLLKAGCPCETQTTFVVLGLKERKHVHCESMGVDDFLIDNFRIGSPFCGELRIYFRVNYQLNLYERG